ncbi:hypothetical protein BN7_1463 [Wickerhamomyces ciferrii]|uniref:Zn(2)-C6 fungal-type domain-containing protein n=1 Tax=Wickerhamomyces ciferrii (strain ATCC 14091 / BCRC 22168 / CBS 111 / JCM 3599 / NBRC 0793 / NRRL Y-1031 F-60-10) TaxID=1206466 RepID=K0KKC7_WICCF|nr:uncharacterized protein BN7_1463 [Wickerhamomyces ciferrii]CCH41924.1 hypothetical protein BN7_1463 [Wickerhamomyces ciferrii]
MSAPSAKSGGKKSHACGPCRRLKRKCDLQIPCGTCKSGRNTKIDECLATPAKPLNNIQELIAPNLKFGRVQKRSPSNSGIGHANSISSTNSASTSNSNSPNVNKRQRASSSSIKNERNNSDAFLSSGNFGSFNLNKSNKVIQESPGSDHQVYSDSRSSAQTSVPVNIQPLQQQPQVLQNTQLNQQQQIPQQPAQVHQPSNSPYQQFQYQNSSIPVQRLSFSQQGLIQQSHHQHQQSPNPAIIPQHTQPQFQVPQVHQPSVSHRLSQSDTSHLQQPINQQQLQVLQQPQPQLPIQPVFTGVQNDLVKKQMEEQSLKIQTLENENAQFKSHVQQLQNQLEKVSKALPTPPSTGSENMNSKNEFKLKFLELLPSQIQTTVLVNFYLQNIDYIYHPLHHPSFRKECEEFWKNQEDVDIGWLAVLFMVLSLAAIHLPKGLINISHQEIEKSHKTWFKASRECITQWDESRKDPKEFNIYTLQCFSLCQLYFYATKRAEALNELLEKAIKDCLAMGLDKDDANNPNLLETQMKRRLWWDIVGCDSFRALSLGVKPLVNSYSSTVPLPANSNDADITPTSIKIRSNSIATDNSFNIYRAEMMRILNGIYEKEHEAQESNNGLKTNLDKVEDKIFKGLIEIDIELCSTFKGWFFQIDKVGNLPNTNDPKIQFQHHMLHICICIHRFRIYQNYLSNGIPIAWEVGVTSARAMFQVYKRLRKIYDLKNPLFLAQIHQAFTGSIIQSMLLLLNHKIALQDQSALYNDIDWMLKDLEVLGRDVFILKPEVLKESFKVLNALRKSINKKLVDLEKDQKDIVSNVFGGKDMTENYLQKCTVSFIIDKVDRKASQDLPAAEEGTFDFKNQLGTLVDSELIQQSVQKFEHLRNFLKPENQQHNDNLEKQIKTMKSQAEKKKKNSQDDSKQLQSSSQSYTPNDNPLIANSQFMMNQTFPLSQEATQPADPNSYPQHNIYSNGNNGYTNGDNVSGQQLNNDANGATDGGFVRQTTPFDMGFVGIDAFWNDVGPQGIDELNNMYYSEFSGYKIV